MEDLPDIDAVLISHNHYDHLDLRTLRQLAARGRSTFIVAARCARLFRSEGIEPVYELDWGESLTLSGFNVHCVPALHFSARGIFDCNKALWCGYVIEFPERLVYFAGDTGFGSHFAQIRDKFGSPTITLHRRVVLRSLCGPHQDVDDLLHSEPPVFSSERKNLASDLRIPYSGHRSSTAPKVSSNSGMCSDLLKISNPTPKFASNKPVNRSTGVPPALSAAVHRCRTWSPRYLLIDSGDQTTVSEVTSRSQQEWRNSSRRTHAPWQN
jgi:hypothetical protein